jgi:hypothetical protein
MVKMVGGIGKKMSVLSRSTAKKEAGKQPVPPCITCGARRGVRWLRYRRCGRGKKLRKGYFDLCCGCCWCDELDVHQRRWERLGADTALACPCGVCSSDDSVFSEPVDDVSLTSTISTSCVTGIEGEGGRAAWVLIGIRRAGVYWR